MIGAVLVFWKRGRPELRLVLIDLYSRKIRAIRAWRKAGFSGVGEVLRSAATFQLLAAEPCAM